MVAGFIEFAIVLQLQRYNERIKTPKSPTSNKSPINFERCKIKGSDIVNWEEQRYIEQMQKEGRERTNFEGCKLRLNKITNSIRRKRMNPDDFKVYYENGNAKKPNSGTTYNVRKIDIVAFGIVGVLFVIFNILYWATFLGFLEPSKIIEKSTSSHCKNSGDQRNSTDSNSTLID